MLAIFFLVALFFHPSVVITLVTVVQALYGTLHVEEQQPLSTNFLCLDKSLKKWEDVLRSCSTGPEMDQQKYIFNGDQFYFIKNLQTTLF